MGSNFMPRSISLKRGIGQIFSRHLDEAVLQDGNARSNLARWFFYSFVKPRKAK